MPKQTTLAAEASLTGAGLHEGGAVAMTLKPAGANEGYVFARTDAEGRTVRACPSNIVEKQRRTLLVENGVEVHTVEHVLAALYGLGVDNAVIELNAPEPPAGDGSSKDFVALVDKAGIRELAEEADVYTPAAPLAFVDGSASLMCAPANGGLTVDYTLDYGVPHLPLMRVRHSVTPRSFREEIGPARTFCLEEEAMALKAAGFGKGANTSNTLVVGPSGVLENKVRFADEFARHKALDVIGDLALAGLRLNATVTAVKSGHGLNQKLAASLRAQYEAERKKPTGEGALDIRGVLELAPHRYPFLMVDRVLEVRGDRVVGIKNVTFNEPCFLGHFPGRPVFPGVLQIEALAQIGGLVVLQKPENRGKLAFFTSADEVKFRRLVIPGDTLRLEATVVRERRGLVEIEAQATVEGELTCSGRLKFMIVDEKSRTT